MADCFMLTAQTQIIEPSTSDSAISYAAEAFRRDLRMTLSSSGKEADSSIRLCLDNPIDCERESYRIHFPEDNVMVIEAPDSLGIVYALFFISETFLGVHPFWWWNDQVFEKSESAKLPCREYRSQPQKVQFRGWFINDEVLIDGWRAEPDNRESWQMALEALLRCGGNMVIPGTDANSKKNRSLASGMGLWITHHHAEPLGAEMFLRAFPDEEPSYNKNGGLFEQLWEQAVLEQQGDNVIWNIGFRGQGDRPFWDDDPLYSEPEQRGKLMADVMIKQMEIVQRHVAAPVFCTNLYGEVLELYQAGHLELPNQVIKIWADNGYGKMVSRRQGNNNPRVPSLPTPEEQGPHGVYYHCSFHDLQASNHLTMSPCPTDFLARELTAAFDAGADNYLIVNSGSVKPHTYPLDLMKDLWRCGSVDTKKHLTEYCRRYYGAYAEDAAKCIRQYADCTAKYGAHEDEKAGEQLFHHPVRELVCAFMRQELNECVSVQWLTGSAPLHKQVQALLDIGQAALPAWRKLEQQASRLLSKMPPKEQPFFFDSIVVQIRLYFDSLQGAIKACESILLSSKGQHAEAYVAAGYAHALYQSAVEALQEAEHDKWRGFYRNDCLTNIRLTVDVMQSYIAYLRIVGDGPSFHLWEDTYFAPKEDRGVKLLSSTNMHRSNEELLEAFMQRRDSEPPANSK